MNQEFINNMRGLLGEEADAFFHALTEKPKTSGLRVNPLKADVSDLDDLSFFPLSPIPWCPTGFYYPFSYSDDTENRPSKHPFYHAGLYYLQEPSAMAPVEALAPQPGDRVLDLCAAPGGKSVQIAGHMQGHGVLVANDASATRSRALVKNLTLCGAKNAVILKETPERLVTRFRGFFDKILVDAPCSGEGMFRKDPAAIKSWTANKPEACVLLQKEILYHAAEMLIPGGTLVYSTCTFNRSENEGTINHFIKNHPEFEVESMERLWPHKIEGEGHFICKLQKKAGSRGAVCPADTQRPTVLNHADSLYVVPAGVPDLAGLRVARSGWYLGDLKKDRFEPSHALALSIARSRWRAVYDLTFEECSRYLRGESFYFDDAPYPNKSWVLMCISGHPLGWARLVNGRLKNKYPKGWMIVPSAPPV